MSGEVLKDYGLDIGARPEDFPPLYACDTFVSIRAERFGAPCAVRIFAADTAEGLAEFDAQRAGFEGYGRSEFIVGCRDALTGVTLEGSARTYAVLVTNRFEGTPLLKAKLACEPVVWDSFTASCLRPLANYFAAVFASTRPTGLDVDTVLYDDDRDLVLLSDIVYSGRRSPRILTADAPDRLLAKLHFYLVTGRVEDDIDVVRRENIDINAGLNDCAGDPVRYAAFFAKKGGLRADKLISSGNPIPIKIDRADSDRVSLGEPKSYHECRDLVEATIALRARDSFKELQLGEEYYEGRGVATFDFQRRNVLDFLGRLSGSGILADQVGMGKTVETGMIISEYAKRKLFRSLLVIVPGSLIGQWQEEMSDKFGLELKEISGPEELDDQPLAIIGFKTFCRGDRAAGFRGRHIDMVILDEAHRLITSHGESTAYRTLESIKRKYCILLSATPIKRELDDLYPLMKLVNPNTYPTRESFIQRACGGKHSVREILAAADGASLLNKIICSVAVRKTKKATRYHALYNPTGIDWKKKISHPVYFAELGGDYAPTVDPASRKEVRYFARGELESAKLTALEEILARHAGEQAVIFCAGESERSAIYARLKKGDRSVFYLAPSDSRAAKESKTRQFEASPAGVLIADNASSEGKNLQFCHVMVHYSILDCPLLMEQRIGRIDRIGQSHDMDIYAFAEHGNLSGYLLPFFDETLKLFSDWEGDIMAVVGDADENAFRSQVRRMWSRRCEHPDPAEGKRIWEEEWQALTGEIAAKMESAGELNEAMDRLFVPDEFDEIVDYQE